MRNIPPADHEMEFTGGALALDFANTIGGTHVAPTHDHLQGYRDLLHFAVRSGSLTATESRRLQARAAREPNRAEAVFELGLALREAVWSVFSALASGETTRERDLALISDAAAAGGARSRLFLDRHGAAWSVPPEADDLDRPLWAIGRSAVEVLTSSARDRLKECASDTCQWVFLDRSKNRSRRWCDMNDCGNVAKVRRYRARSRAAAPSS